MNKIIIISGWISVLCFLFIVLIAVCNTWKFVNDALFNKLLETSLILLVGSVFMAMIGLKIKEFYEED